MEHVGRQEELGIGIESVRNTPISAPQKCIKNVSSSVISRTERATDDNTRGVLEDSEGARVTRKWFDGDVEGIAHVDALGYLFANIYGQVTTGPVGTGAYEHEFEVDQTIEHPSLSVFRKDDGATQKVYSGGVINTLEISATTDDYVRFTANIICSQEASNSSTFTYDTEYDFIGKDITIKLADTEVGLSTAPVISAKEMSVSYDLGAISDFRFGSYNPSNYNAKLAIEVEFTKNFVDTTYEDLFKSGAYKYMEISIIGDATIGVNQKPTITLLMNKTQIINWERDGGADDLVEETVTIKAFYNQTDTQQSMLTLINLTPSYSAGS